MSGPAPKDAAERVRRAGAQRGEWLELPPVTDPVPECPLDDVCLTALAAWASWWSDPASTQWLPAQRNAVLELLVLTNAFWQGETKVANEMRLRQDALGLTEKGKRDLRWRVPLDEAEVADEPVDDPYAELVADALEDVRTD